jgi:hypothetical protein
MGNKSSSDEQKKQNNKIRYCTETFTERIAKQKSPKLCMASGCEHYRMYFYENIFGRTPIKTLYCEYHRCEGCNGLTTGYWQACIKCKCRYKDCTSHRRENEDYCSNLKCRKSREEEINKIDII